MGIKHYSYSFILGYAILNLPELLLSFYASVKKLHLKLKGNDARIIHTSTTNPCVVVDTINRETEAELLVTRDDADIDICTDGEDISQCRQCGETDFSSVMQRVAAIEYMINKKNETCQHLECQATGVDNANPSTQRTAVSTTTVNETIDKKINPIMEKLEEAEKRNR